MPRRRAILFLTVVALVTSSEAVPAQGSPMSPADAEVELWSSAVRSHVPGQLDGHDRAIAAWPWKRVQGVIAALLQRPGTPPALLLRAASLYSDVAFFIPINERPLYKATSGMLAQDGRRIGSAWLDSHLQVGQELVQRAVRRQHATNEIRQLASQWYVAVAAVLAHQLALADLQPHLQHARETLPDDAEILFAAACMAETFAAPFSQAAVPAAAAPSRTRAVDALHSLRLSRAQNLRDAERDFRRVLDLAPSNSEARVRLGHVLIERGRAADAAAALEQASDEAEGDAAVRYYRALFLGRARELANRPADARTWFARAAALFPRAQSPRLAISRLAAAAGDHRGAQEAMAVVFALPGHEQERVDPWWVYYLGPGRNAAVAYDAVSTALARLILPAPGAAR